MVTQLKLVISESEKIEVLIKGHGPKNQDPKEGAHYQATIVDYHVGMTTTLEGPVEGLQTAHRAAQEAVIRTLEELRDRTGNADESCDQIDIWTKDRYVADGMGEAGRKWKENGYKDSNNKPLTNADNFKKMHDLRDELQQRGWKVRVTHNSKSQVVGTVGEKRVESTAGQPAAEKGGAGLPDRRRSSTKPAVDPKLGQDAEQNRETVRHTLDDQGSGN